MLERLPEPELMLTPEQAEAYASVDMSALHQQMIRVFGERFGEMNAGRMLDLGCGPADISIRFARAFPSITVLGVDGSEAMLALGRVAVHQADLEGRITLEQRYLPDESLERAAFDAVVANSLLHHLAQPGVMWRSAIGAARKGAPVLVMDLHRPERQHIAREIVDRYASSAPALLQEDFFNSLCAAYTTTEVRRQLDDAGLKAFQVEVVDEAHLVVWGGHERD